MADTLEKRVADIEYLLAHIPGDLDARFAGVDVKLAELRELMFLQGSRITKLESRLTELARKVDELSRKVDAQGSKLDELSRKVDAQGSKLEAQGGKLDEILARLPKP